MCLVRIVAQFLSYPQGKDQRGLAMEPLWYQGLYLFCRPAFHENHIFLLLSQIYFHQEAIDTDGYYRIIAALHFYLRTFCDLDAKTLLRRR